MGKISRTLGIMKKIKRFAPLLAMKSLYHSLVHSRLTYGIKCWGFAHSKLEVIQKKAIRIMTNKKSNTHTDPLFKTNKILKVGDLFRLNCLKMHYRIERDLAAPVFRTLHTRNWEIHNHNTRRQDIRIMHPNFQSNTDCFRFFLPRLLNEIPSELLERIHTSSICTFAYHLKEYFFQQYPTVCLKHVCPQCGRLPD